MEKHGGIPMKKQVRLRLWLETILASTTGVLFLITLVSKDWIERVFGIDLDGGNGTFEWLIVGGLLVATIMLFVLARLEWQKSRTAVGDLSH
jgi:hypothetical protein